MTPLTASGSSLRRAFEFGVRTLGVAVLLLLLWKLLDSDVGSDANASRVTLASSDDSTALVRSLIRTLGSTDADRAPTRVNASSLGDAGDRGALQALRAAGVPLEWRDSTGARGLVIGVAQLPDPQGASMITSSASSDARPLVVHDAAGVIDSIASTDAKSDGVGTTVLVRHVAGTPTARRAESVARASADTISPLVKRVLLYARPGWEAKFTTAALEESGWSVDGSIVIAPRASVTIGAPRTLDTARYAAAIVLDSGVAPTTALERFARNGGGVIVAGDGVRDRALAAFLPATGGERRPPVPGALLTADPSQGLERHPLAPRGGAIVLAAERVDGARAGTPMQVAARRGSGRVVVSGYRESWRWRMEGGKDGIDAHRRWWNGLVRSVAYAPSAVFTSYSAVYPGDAAPYADLVARLGAPRAGADSTPRDRVSRRLASSLPSDGVLLALALGALVAEWISRRMRGAC